MKVLLLIGIVIGSGVLIFLYSRKLPLGVSVPTNPDVKIRKLAGDAVRLLDLGLTDPMFRQSGDWEKAAQKIVNNFYEKEIHK